MTVSGLARTLSIAALLLCSPLLSERPARAENERAASADFYLQLARHHAPVVVQGLGVRPAADVFTRFDFDGDWNAFNNWKHLGDAGLPPAAYYDVIESRTHWFITYGFFYPRDYSSVCFWIRCHENDFEGMRITVAKDPELPFGKLWLLETLAHHIWSFDESPAMVNGRAIVVIEKEGHGIHPWKDRRPDRKTHLYNGEDYELLSMLDLWAHRDEVGDGRTFSGRYDYKGERFEMKNLPESFGGKKWSNGMADPAWSWSIFTPGVSRGDWFLDPVSTLCRNLECPKDFSREYVRHSYIPSAVGSSGHDAHGRSH